MNVAAHNIYAMNAHRMYETTIKKKEKSMEKLSSGYRINRSADDAAGLQISEKMRQYIRGLDRGKKNTMEGISWLQIADGAMNEAHDMVQRVRELAIQSANGTNSDSDRASIDAEIQQIKNELDHISDHTLFNEDKVFLDEYVAMDVEGELSDLEVFDATYNDATGEVTFGGFVFHEFRIPWNSIDSNMVGVDTSGKQVFKGGEYSCRLPNGMGEFHFSCNDGAEVPKITRTINVRADTSGVKVDGKNIPWNEVKDEHGVPLSNNNLHSGQWSIDYEGVKIRFFIGKKVSSVDDIISGINSCKSANMVYSLQSQFSGFRPEQAVDLDGKSKIEVHSSLASNPDVITASDVKYFIGADDTGVWLEEADQAGNRSGQPVLGSHKSWADLKIKSWMEGPYIKEDITYEYKDDDNDKQNDTYVSFSFSLSDITSVDSVIDGLDGVKLQGQSFQTSYETAIELKSDNIILAIIPHKFSTYTSIVVSGIL